MKYLIIVLYLILAACKPDCSEKNLVYNTVTKVDGCNDGDMYNYRRCRFELAGGEIVIGPWFWRVGDKLWAYKNCGLIDETNLYWHSWIER